MKRIYTAFIFCFLLNGLFGQNERYDFLSSTEIYVPLTNAEAAAFEPDADWTDFDELLELELEFGFTISILGLESEGMFNLFSPELLVTSFDDEADDPILTFLIPTTTQLQNRGVVAGNNPSEVYFQTTGTPGVQIFKLEYRDVGFANESFLENPSQDMFTNMQIWIYEGSGCIEFRYGATSITDPELIYEENTGSSSGLFSSLSSELDGGGAIYAIFTSGDAQNPSVFEGENTMTDIGLDIIGFPGDGVVYTFCPELDVNTNDLANTLNWEVYPNPTLDFLTLKLNDVASANFKIIAMNGQEVRSGMIDFNNQKVDVRDLSKGIYMLTVQTENGIATKRFWKK